MDDNKKKFLYEILFSLLALTAIFIAILDILGKVNLTTNHALGMVDTGILVIFTLDYFIRLFLADNKKVFFRKNIPDLIAILPFNAFFKIFRISKLFRFVKMTKFLRLAGFSGKFLKTSYRFLRTNGLIYALAFTLLIMILSAIGISITEKMSFQDAIWWSFVTATTVGYGDLSPSTSTGRMIAGFLMLVGIGTIGMITGTIATYFLTEKETLSDNQPIRELIESSSDLTEMEKQEVMEFIDYLKHRRK